MLAILRYLVCLVFISGVLYAGQSQNHDNAQRQVVIVTALYTDGSSSWRLILSDTLEDTLTRFQFPPSQNLVIKPLLIKEKYQLTYRHIQTALQTLENLGVAVIIGPYNEALRLAAIDADVPYVILTQPRDRPHPTTYGAHELYLHPPEDTIRQAVCDVALTYGWKQAAVIYNDRHGLQLIGQLMLSGNLAVRSWHLPTVILQTDIRNCLLDIREKQLRQVIIATDRQTVEIIFKEALRLSMLSSYYTWIIAEPLSYELDLSQYNYTQVNLSVFHLGPETPVLPYITPLDAEGTETTVGALEHKASMFSQSSLNSRLTTDAINVVIRAALRYVSQAKQQPCSPSVDCVDFISGSSLAPYLKTDVVLGETGPLVFEGQSSTRSNISLTLLRLAETGLKRVGEWTSLGGNFSERLIIDNGSVGNVFRTSFVGPFPLGREPLDIVFMIDAPFVMRKRDYKERAGNDRYEGFLIDLISNIANKLHFQYTLYESPDGNYGSKQGDDWNGMIGELIAGNASMCLGAISITAERESAVDFTKPFMQKTFNILIKKPLERTSPFQFLWPLSYEIWVCTLSVLAVVSILLFIMDRLSPNFPQSGTSFSLSESVWFMYGSLVGAGVEVFPRTASARLLSAAWWFFSLILVSSYTANLAAFLTVTRIVTPIKSIPDLAGQTKIKYGTVKNTYAHSSFRNSKIEVIKKMWNFMDQLNPDSMVDNSSVGIQKVKNGNYAFIWDSPINKYIAMHECDTMVVGEPFDEKGLGIGVPLGAPYRDILTMAILGLQEDGTSQMLLDKWWGSGQCEDFQETTTSGTKELAMANIAGVFLVLAGGVIVSLCVCGAEFLHTKLKDRILRKKTLQDAEQECPMSAIPVSNNFMRSSKADEREVR